jgi:hypothetical protein
MAYAQNLPPGGQRNSFIERSAREWAERDPAAAQAMIEKLPGGASKDSFVQGLVSGMAQHDPASAASYVATLPEGTAQNSAAASVIGQWTSTDPAAASQWAVGFKGEAREQALNTVIQGWADNDPEASARWLSQLPNDGAKQTAINTYVGEMTSRYPSYAATVVGGIADEGQRHESISRIFRAWKRSDPGAAEQWLGTTSLPKEQIRGLLGKGKD